MIRGLAQYGRVFLTFARNSLVRDMTFRTNFIIETISSFGWMGINLGFYILIFQYTPALGTGAGAWDKYQFFILVSTGLLVNSLVQTLFMVNVDEFSELIRSGSLDFVLLKPIDTQFLISLQRVDWSSLGNFFCGLGLLVYSLMRIEYAPGPVQFVLYPIYVVCGVTIFYALMIALAATSVWMGRNESLYDFWFYIVNFARYPMEIYQGPVGRPMRLFFTFIVPVLIVVNVPARLLARPMNPESLEDWYLPLFALAASVVSLAGSRWIFSRALESYRSASS
jgi:ABC-2 type transport system permease protein